MTWSKLSMNFPQLRRFDLVKTILSKKKKNSENSELSSFFQNKQ